MEAKPPKAYPFPTTKKPVVSKKTKAEYNQYKANYNASKESDHVILA